MNALIEQIFSIDSENAFEEAALRVFEYQFKNVPIYGNYCKSINKTSASSIQDIPFLPISFFKTHNVLAEGLEPSTVFKSSGTGGDRSMHLIHDLSIYERSFLNFYKKAIGDPKDQVIIALLPSYLEQGESSLVYMVDKLMKESSDPRSKFILSDMSELKSLYESALHDSKQPVLFGVSYALLDLADLGASYPELTIIETGGMKGRRKELTKIEMHSILQSKLNPKSISSEYGMTELLSQGYSNGATNFKTPNWMRVLIREVDDPFTFERIEKTGGINVIDLANIYSCSFIATQDLGKLHDDGTFDVLGRFDHSDIRGCNLLVQ